MLTINLNSPRGNAFALISQAQTFAKQLDYSDTQMQRLVSDMRASDYEHLLAVFRSHFSGYCQLVHEDYDR